MRPPLPRGEPGLEALNAQLQTSWFMLWAGLEELSEEEYAWDPPLRRDPLGGPPELIAAGAEMLLLRNLYRPG